MAMHRCVVAPSVALLGLLVCMPSASAADYTWNVPAGGVQQWTTPANWDPNTGAPTTADDTANLGVGLAGNLTLDIGATDVTVGAITIGGTAGPVTTDLNGTGGNLILNSNAANASITSGGVAGSVNRISAPLVLGDALDLPATATRDITLAGNLGMTGGARAVTNLMTGGQTLTIGSGSASTIKLYDVLAPDHGLPATAQRAPRRLRHHVAHHGDQREVGQHGRHRLLAGPRGEQCESRSHLRPDAVADEFGKPHHQPAGLPSRG